MAKKTCQNMFTLADQMNCFLTKNIINCNRKATPSVYLAPFLSPTPHFRYSLLNAFYLSLSQSWSWVLFSPDTSQLVLCLWAMQYVLCLLQLIRSALHGYIWLPFALDTFSSGSSFLRMDWSRWRYLCPEHSIISVTVWSNPPSPKL